MARGGINKTLVQMARDRLLAKGRHPSVDAVRVELGQTGSKATIHRYLKELESENPLKTNDLNEALTKFVASLAAQLQQDAEAVVEAAKTAHQSQVESLNQQLSQLRQSLLASQDRNQLLESQLSEAQRQANETSEEARRNALAYARTEQELSGQKSLNEQKDAHIRSIEEKHRHARESLEHFRASVKDQREQEARRHEQQLQQMQAELRQLNQTLSIKQTDIVQLNKANGELASEVKSLRRQLTKADSEQRQLESRNELTEQENARLRTEIEGLRQSAAHDYQEMKTLKKQLDEVAAEHKRLELTLAGVQAELAAKDQMFEKLSLRIPALKEPPVGADGSTPAIDQQ